METFPLRITHVFGIMNRGGAETFIMNVYRKIDRNKIQFDFIVHSEEKGDFDDEISALGGEIYSIPRYTGTNHYSYKKAWRKLLPKLNNSKVIHSHINSTASIFFKILKKEGFYLIAHSHSTSNGSGLSSKVKNIYQKKINTYSDTNFACGEDAGNWLFGAGKFDILKNGIDPENFSFSIENRINIRKELAIEDNLVFGHVGSFNEVKNHDFIIDTFKSYHSSQPNSSLLLVGDGKLKKIIEKKVNKYGIIDSVKFLGLQSDISSLMSAMDVLLFPSLYEGIPVTLIEAQSVGLTCFVSDKVSKEASISEYIKFIEIDAGTEKWKYNMVNFVEPMRGKNTFISENGYDINATVEELVNFYFNIK